MGQLRRELWHFFVHLRCHYQVLVVSGAYLLGGLYQPDLGLPLFVLQFVNVHVLLLGGATVYNSFFDRDEGPIGGLRHPPPLAAWTRPASVIVQFIGLLVGLPAGPLFVAVYAGSMLLFWLYSTPSHRWKGQPHKSLVVIGLGNGVNLFLLGYLAAGQAPLRAAALIAGLGVALILLSLYPASQAFQMPEDARRGDRTFALRHGLAGVRRVFVVCYPSGVLIIAMTLLLQHGWLGAGLVLPAAAVGVVSWRVLEGLRGLESDYASVMRLKYATSGLFVAFIAVGLTVIHYR